MRLARALPLCDFVRDSYGLAVYLGRLPECGLVEVVREIRAQAAAKCAFFSNCRAVPLGLQIGMQIQFEA